MNIHCWVESQTYITPFFPRPLRERAGVRGLTRLNKVATGLAPFLKGGEKGDFLINKCIFYYVYFFSFLR